MKVSAPCVLFIWAAAAIFAQTVPTAKVADKALLVFSQGDEWKIDLETLPFDKSDCSPADEAYNRPMGIIGCSYHPTVAGSTLSPPRVLFTLSVGMVAKNVTQVLFEADVARHSIRRLLSADSYIAGILFSPSGRYLAYSVEWSSGICHHTSSVFVADIGGPGKAAGPATVAEVDTISPQMLAEPVRWATAERLTFRESTFDGDDSCKRRPWRTKTADMSSLHFH